MSNEGVWKWWVSSFAIPLAMFLASASIVFFEYLNYAKDVNEIRVEVEKRYKEDVEKLNRFIAEQNLTIKKQNDALEKLNKKGTPAPAPPPQIDYSKYWYLFSEVAEPKSFAEHFLGFLKDHWKTLAVLTGILAVMGIAGFLSETMKNR
jgi:hypothetical protein